MLDTLNKAVETSQNIDVDVHFYSPVVRERGEQFSTRHVPSDSLLNDLADQAYVLGLRLDFMHGDMCYFMVHAKQP